MFNIFKSSTKFNPVVVSVKFNKKQSPNVVQTTPILKKKINFDSEQLVDNDIIMNESKNKAKRKYKKRKKTPIKKKSLTKTNTSKKH